MPAVGPLKEDKGRDLRPAALLPCPAPPGRFRSVALRPTLSSGLPFSSLVKNNFLCAEVEQKECQVRFFYLIVDGSETVIHVTICKI